MSPAPADRVDSKAMDGGWGWMVVIGAHISIGFAYSLPKVLSIFFKEIQEELGISSSEIALISSVMLAVTYGGGEFIQSVFVASVCLFGKIGTTISDIIVKGIALSDLSLSRCFVDNVLILIYLCSRVNTACVC